MSGLTLRGRSFVIIGIVHELGATINLQVRGGGGLQFLSRTNYLFQPGSAALQKIKIVLHVYSHYMLIHNSSCGKLFISRRVHQTLFIKKTQAPPPQYCVCWVLTTFGFVKFDLNFLNGTIEQIECRLVLCFLVTSWGFKLDSADIFLYKP